jgi:hypothetical protein
MKKIFSILLLTILSLPQMVFAGNLTTAPKVLGRVADKTGVNKKLGIEELVGTVINTVLSFVGIIFLALMVYAGYLWLTARGEEAPIEKAKKIINSSIIGLVLTLGAYAITVLITSRLGK